MPCTLLDYRNSQVSKGAIFEDEYNKFISFICVHVQLRNEQMCCLLACISLQDILGLVFESPMSTCVCGIESYGKHCQSFWEWAVKEQPTNMIWNLETIDIILQQVQVYCNIFLIHMAFYGPLDIQNLQPRPTIKIEERNWGMSYPSPSTHVRYLHMCVCVTYVTPSNLIKFPYYNNPRFLGFNLSTY